MQLSKHCHKSEFLYSMSGQVLKIVEQHSYLGVIIDHRLSWKPHVDYLSGKAMKLIGSLNQLRRESAQLIRLYKIIIYYKFQLTIFQFHHQLLPPDQEMT